MRNSKKWKILENYVHVKIAFSIFVDKRFVKTEGSHFIKNERNLNSTNKSGKVQAKDVKIETCLYRTISLTIQEKKNPSNFILLSIFQIIFKFDFREGFP